MNSKEKKTISKKASPFIKFSSLGIQMGIIIAFFTWLGVYLDEKFQLRTPWLTICLSLFGVCSSLYLVIKEVIKMGRDNE
ncbi:MAG: AtpZ/AtpI family protein [Bacteroidota bacterium]